MILTLVACGNDTHMTQSSMEGPDAPAGSSGMTVVAGRAAASSGTAGTTIPGAAGGGVAGRIGAGNAGAAASRMNRALGVMAGRSGAATPAAGSLGASGMAGVLAAGSSAPGNGTAGVGSDGVPGSDEPGGFAPCPMGMPCKILPFGDSITFGIGYAGGYRVELFRKAQAADKSITFLGSVRNGPAMVEGVTFPQQNEGHSGFKINQLAQYIKQNGGPPHIVLVMLGTNDIAQNDDVANAPKRLGDLIDMLIVESPEALIVVAKLTPLSSGSASVMTYNDALAPIIDARVKAGKHVVLVDQFMDFPSSELGDGVHPNQKGYERMAGVWYEAIINYLR